MEGLHPPNNDLEKARQLYSKTNELEKQLRNELKKKSPLDRSVALLRNNIRDNYEQVLFLNYEFAISKDVEQSIWKSVFYRVIEEFRKRLRKNAPSQPTPPLDEEQKRTGASFKQFLTSAMNFYQRLLCKLQAGFHLTLDGSVSYRLQDDSVKLHRSYLSCHRCFIFMGDLARYHKDIRQDENDTTPPVWTKAAQYYQRALLILPDNGNPHNQLAVLATYEDDGFTGVYRYFRSLAIRQPFVTARDNLKVLFEKNRLKLEAEDGSRDDRLDLFLLRFVRLHGIFFNKAELDSLSPLKATLLRSFSVLLANNALDMPTLLKAIAMLIFTIHNVAVLRSPDEQPPSPINKPHHHMQLQAVGIAFEFVAVLARACAQDQFDAERCAAHLACVGVFLEWVRVHPEHIPRAVPAGGLWDALAQLLNFLTTINLDTSKSAPFPVYLEAEAELRGFLPLHNYIKNLPHASLVTDPAKERKLSNSEIWMVLSFRVRKLRELGSFICGLSPQVVFHNKDTGLYSTPTYKPNSLTMVAKVSPLPVQRIPEDRSSSEDDSEEMDDASFAASKFEFVEDEDDDPIMFNQPIVQDDDLEDEVILFRPDQTNARVPANNANGHARSNSASPAPSPSASPSPSPSLSSVSAATALHNGHPNGAVHTRGAEFGIIGSRPKTPPHEATSPNLTSATNTNANGTSTPQSSPHSSDPRFYSNFDFSSYYGLSHPFTIAETSSNTQQAAASPSTPLTSLFSNDPKSPSTPLSSLFSDAKYSLFSADSSSSIPPVIDMPFHSSPSPPMHTQGTPNTNASQESDVHSPTCTNKDSPFAWLTPVPLTLSGGYPSPPLYPSNDFAVAPTPFLDTAILSAGVALPFPFPGEPTLKFRTKNPFINT